MADGADSEFIFPAEPAQADVDLNSWQFWQEFLSQVWLTSVLVSLWCLTYVFQIDWSEPWLIALILSHISCTITIFLTRKMQILQIILAAILCKSERFCRLLRLYLLIVVSVVLVAEQLNEYAALHWQ